MNNNRTAKRLNFEFQQFLEIIVTVTWKTVSVTVLPSLNCHPLLGFLQNHASRLHHMHLLCSLHPTGRTVQPAEVMGIKGEHFLCKHWSNWNASEIWSKEKWSLRLLSFRVSVIQNNSSWVISWLCLTFIFWSYCQRHIGGIKYNTTLINTCHFPLPSLRIV